MSKVILTQKQADAIIRNENEGLENSDILYRYLRFDGYDEQFRGLTFGALADALYIGYEVEPTFEVGDMVSLECEGTIRAIGEIVSLKKEDGVTYACVQDPKYPVPQKVSVNALHHSTPEEIAKEKERRWWAKHGREPWQLKPFDILEINDDRGEVANINNAELEFNSFYHGNITIVWHEFEGLKHKTKVICFVGSRSDVKDDE